tara:strand:- start:54 stop:851 length:798 start_codon:yes stop_codon:yes gene_type:complete
MLNVLSLGAGVQSSCMALMAANGELEPMPDCAIFADTGAEPQSVYEFLDYIEPLVPFPVHRVMEREGLERDVYNAINGARCATPPFYTHSESGNKGILRRQCTSEYKIKPIQKKVRELMGLESGQRGPKEIAVKMWIGISLDESVRMKPNQIKWIENIWPLINKGMYRYDCLKWMMEHGYKEPRKSACYFCPYHDNATWKNMMDHDKDSWDKVVKFDSAIRAGLSGVTDPIFLHRSMQPIDEVDFDPSRDQFDMFDHECEGMCGV